MQKILLVFSFILFVLGCSTNNQHHVFTKPPKEKLDSLCQYLSENDHNSDSNYNRIYIDAYNKLIDLKKYDSASRVLDIKGKRLEQTFVPDTAYMNITYHHLKQYKDKISNRYVSALYNRLGMQNSYQNEWDSSYWYLKKAYVPKTDYYTTIEVAYADLFICYYFFRNGRMDSSLKFGLQSKDGFKQAGDTRLEVKALNQIYYLYIFTEDYDEAKKTLVLADSMAKSIKDSLFIFYTYYDKIHYYSVNPAYQISYNKSLAQEAENMYSFFKKWNPQGSANLDHHVQMHLLYAHMLIDKSDLKTAKQHLDSAKSYLNKMNPPSTFRLEDYDYEFDIYQMNAGVVDIKLEKYDDILKDMEEQKQYFALQEHYDLFYRNAIRQKDYVKALAIKEKYDIITDSLTNVALRTRVIDFDKKYQTAKKEKTIAEQKSKLINSKFQITTLLFSLVGLILGTLIFFGIRKRKEAQAETIRQQKFTDELLQNTEDERKRIATDLHDSVNHELLTLKNQAINGKLANSDEIEKVINEVRQVSRDLYPAMFDNIGLVASIEALCERMTEAGLFTSCDINYTLKLSKRNELQLYRIIQEALNNTLKHAKADAAKVTIDTVGNELQVEIKDNGIGFDTTDKMNNASSFGIQSLMQRARAIGGKSTIESDKNGTKLILKTPIH